MLSPEASLTAVNIKVNPFPTHCTHVAEKGGLYIPIHVVPGTCSNSLSPMAALSQFFVKTNWKLAGWTPRQLMTAIQEAAPVTLPGITLNKKTMTSNMKLICKYFTRLKKKGDRKAEVLTYLERKTVCRSHNQIQGTLSHDLMKRWLANVTQIALFGRDYMTKYLPH